MEDNKLLTFIYSLFLGLILALFVGLGINTFYPAPEEPKYPDIVNTYDGKEVPAEVRKQEQEYSIKQEAYQDKFQDYSLNVSIVALVASVLLLAASLVIPDRHKIIANGVLLGGLFTLLYSLIRGLISGDSKFQFVIVTVALAIVLYLGYRRFSAPDTTKKVKAKAKKS